MKKELLFETLKSICQDRKSVRDFDGQALSEEEIAAIREISLTTPYASGKKNWKLLIITDRSIIAELASLVHERSRELAGRVREDFREMFLQYAENFSHFDTAPALFIPVYKVQHSLSLMLGSDANDIDIIGWERDNYVKSISCVIMLVLLAAESLGLRACCMTGPLLAEKKIARRIGVKPGFGIGAIIPVGHEKGEKISR
jgi:nitroreductase